MPGERVTFEIGYEGRRMVARTVFRQSSSRGFSCQICEIQLVNPNPKVSFRMFRGVPNMVLGSCSHQLGARGMCGHSEKTSTLKQFRPQLINHPHHPNVDFYHSTT